MADDAVPQDDPTPLAGDETIIAACDWSDYRKDYGVSAGPKVLSKEHQIFLAGWRAGNDHGKGVNR